MKSDFRFFYRHRVRWAECDPQWVVFNGHYLTYFDVAITEYARAVGLPDVMAQQQSGQELFARKATVEYHAPAKYDDEIDIYARVAYLGRSSLRFVLAIYREDALITTGEIVYVCVATASGSSTDLPNDWRQRVQSFEVTTIEERGAT